MTPRMNNVVHKELTLDLSPPEVFRAFTEDLDRWWPCSHKIGKTELKRAVLEPREGGRWYEIDDDGSECDWGRVAVWRPPTRLVLSWQITAAWKFDPDFSTSVEVSFLAEGSKQTHLTLQHRDLDKFGETASKMQVAFDSEHGWTGLLDSFAKYMAALSAVTHEK